MSAPGSGYLDAAATAPLRPEARAAMIAAIDEGQANPSSVHAHGHRAEAALEAARSTVAESLGARPAEVVFTSGGTEANNLAIIGLALASPRGRHIVTSPLEHPSVLESARYLERRFGFAVDFAEPDAHGTVTNSAVAKVLRDDTTLVSIGLANAEIGTVQPISEIAESMRGSGALLHTDAVQAAASLPVSFGSRGAGGAAGDWPGVAIDAMTIASHKFGGPQGAGALLVRTRHPIEPLLHGGGQEAGRRSGTENLVGLAGFAAALRASAAQVGFRALDLIAARDALISRVLAEVPVARLTGDRLERLPGHASFVVEGVSGESLLVALDAAGFSVSSGSACAAGKDEPSPALLAIGVPPELAQTAIRFTLAEPIGEHEIERIVRVLRAETGSALTEPLR